VQSGNRAGCISEIKEKKDFFFFVFRSICTTFAPDLVMCVVFHHVHKRESGVNPEQYPLL
jgi:hypothetical protein